MSENSLEQLNKKIADLENELVNYKEKGKILEKKLNQLENDVKHLKKRQDYLKSESYRDYYFEHSTNNANNEVIKRLSETLDLDGNILELKALNDFKKYKYSANEYFYIDKQEGKTRQIDIIAKKCLEFKIAETNTKIVFKLWIVADCKFKSHMDLLCFDVGKDSEDLSLFPIFTAPDYRFAFDRFPPPVLITSKVTQLVMEGHKNHKDDHLKDRVIYESSRQVYSCIKSIYDEEFARYKNHMRLELDRSPYIQKVISISKKESDINNKNLRDYLGFKSVYGLFTGIERLYFDVFVPVIIFDENRGIMKAKLNSKYQLENLEDLEISLYEFSKGYQLDEGDSEQDYIFLVNRQGLIKLFKYLDEYIGTFESYFRNLFEKFPLTLVGLFKNLYKDY